ncbi:MAG: glucose-1-phosphate cytidylyltransferase, partial [Patescibacteria group bacterium]
MKEETEFKPKPLVMVGDKPIIQHIMNIYSHFGFNEFILTLGYKGKMIKEYFKNESHNFKIHLLDTGAESLTGERVLRVAHLIREDNFMVTYGDGVANIDIN